MPVWLCKLISALFCEPQTDAYAPSSVFLYPQALERAAAAHGRRLVEMLRVLRNPFNRRCAALTECTRSDAESARLNSHAGRARAPF